MVAALSELELHRRWCDGHDAHTGALAEPLGDSPAAATTTVTRPAERRLLHHKLHRGVGQLDAGRAEAVAALRRHRIVERFLAVGDEGAPHIFVEKVPPQGGPGSKERSP